MKPMKKLLFTFSLLAVIILNLDAQHWFNKYYPDKNLSELNSDELLVLSQKASSKVSWGMVVTLSGVGITVTAGALIINAFYNDMVSSENNLDQYGRSLAIVAAAGVVITAVGITEIIIGSSRKRAISNTINFQKTHASLHITPSFQYNNIQNNYSPGLAISLRF
jgi:hypothetical protein